ncbi:MAG: FtsQ-type POTRA domain-containing protein [Actinomycetota bacterium]
MSEADGTEPPKRRTIVIGEPSLDLAPGSGPIFDPLLIPLPGDTRPDANRTTAAMVLPGADTTVTLADPPSVGGGLRTVVIGGSDEDDLPDPSYTAQSSRSPDDPRGPRVHPRLKARRLAVRQQAGRRRILWSAVAGVFVLISLATIAVLATPLFAISNIKVSGLVYSDQESVSGITASIRNKPILTADLNSVKRRLLALPWVKYATVQMQFPHTVTIQIAERTPVAAFLGEDNLWRPIDPEGRVIDVLEGRPVDYMPIYGLGPALKAGESSAEYARVAQLITALPPALRAIVKVFEVDQQYNVSMTIRISKRGDTLVDLCAARDLDVLQVVSLTAFLNTKVNPKQAPPGRITACRADLITTSES